jgi:hypothetical protein
MPRAPISALIEIKDGRHHVEGLVQRGKRGPLAQTAIATKPARSAGSTVTPDRHPVQALWRAIRYRLGGEKLSDVLDKLDKPALTKLLRDYEAGGLEQICR